MKTVKEWFDYFKVLPNMVFGLEMQHGLHCKLENYKSPEQFEQEVIPGWGEEIIYRIYPINTIRNNVNYCLIVYKDPIV